jgi:hypothetical protein
MTDSSELGGFAMTAVMLICAGLFGPEQHVFNLDVARNFTFFVGAHKELVHDNSLPPPVLTPFDAEPSLASMAE